MPDCTHTWKDRVTPSSPDTPYTNPVIVPITISGEKQFEYPLRFKLPDADLSTKPVTDSTTGEKTNGLEQNEAYSLNKREEVIVKQYGVEGHPDQVITANIKIDRHTGEVTVGLLFDPTIDLKEQQLLVPLNVNIHNGNGTATQEVVMVINAAGNKPDLNFNREMSPAPGETQPDYVEKAENSIKVLDYQGYFQNLKNQLDNLNN